MPTAIFTHTEDRIARPRDLYGLVPGQHHQRELHAS